MDLSRLNLVQDAPLGARVSMRVAEPSGAQSDVVGEVVRYGGDHLEIQPWDRGPVMVALDSIVACRQVPAKALRPRSSAADLERLASHQWPGLRMVRLGGWEIRLGDGCTKRANSALAEGDPGLALADAVRRVEEVYTEAGLAPRLEVVVGEAPHPARDLCLALGWQPEGATCFLVTDLRQATEVPDDAGVEVVTTWTPSPDDAWLAGPSRGRSLFGRIVTAAPADYLALRMGAESGDVVATARVARTADWAGLSCLWVAPEVRGRGLGRRLLHEITGHSLADAARFAYLQVEESNEMALAWYLRAGWQEHHRYAYLRRV